MYSICVFPVQILLILSYSTLNQPYVYAYESEYDDPFLSVPPAAEKAARNFLSSLNELVDPCDNFYKFTCSNSIYTRTIGLDVPKKQMIDEIEGDMTKNIRNDVKDIRADSSSYLKKLEIFYDNCKKSSEEENKNALLEIINHVGGMPVLQGSNWASNEFDWLEMVFKLRSYGFRPKLPADIKVWSRGLSDDPKEYNVIVKPHEFREYCFLHDMVKLVVKFGANEEAAKKEMQEVCAFEKRLLEMSLVEKDKFQHRTVNGLETHPKYNYLPWRKIFHNYFFNTNMKFDNMTFDENTIFYFERAHLFEHLKELIRDTPKRVVANFLTWHAMNDVTQFLNEVTSCEEALKKFMPRAIEAMYVQNYIATGTKDIVHNLTEEIKNELIRRIQKADWIQDRLEGDNYKELYIQKVKKMRYVLGYPDEYLDNEVMVDYYKDFEVVYESFLRTALKTMKYLEISKLNMLKKDKRRNWDMHLFGTNDTHYYSYYNNKFELPVIFLNEEMVHPDKPQYLNYGYLGTTIAKLFAHVVDNIGLYRDADYHLLPQAKSTEAELANKQNCLKKQYNSYYIKGANRYVKGNATLTMNMVDNIGLKIAYHAYVDWAKRNNIVEPNLPTLKYSAKQMFWISAASYHCAIYRDSSDLLNIINFYIESPPEARVMVPFSNMKEFAEDFQCKPGSRMNPVEKCSIL